MEITSPKNEIKRTTNSPLRLCPNLVKETIQIDFEFKYFDHREGTTHPNKSPLGCNCSKPSSQPQPHFFKGNHDSFIILATSRSTRSSENRPLVQASLRKVYLWMRFIRANHFSINHCRHHVNHSKLFFSFSPSLCSDIS